MHAFGVTRVFKFAQSEGAYALIRPIRCFLFKVPVLPTEIFVGKNVVDHAGALNELSHCKSSIQFIWYFVDPKGVLTHRIKNMSINKYTSM
jgi:hypothetical protein